MKRIIWTAVVALVAVVPVKAAGFLNPPCKIECGANVYCRISSPYSICGANCGPWYLYWPLDAHFQTPGNPCYPFWPQPMGLPQTPGPYGPGVPPMPPVPAQPGEAPRTPEGTPAPPMQKVPEVKPIIYQIPIYQAPVYWYGH